jgi:acyl-ACP thioesterase
MARAMSSWLLLHSETKRIQKPERVLPPALFDPTKAPSWQPEKLVISGHLAGEEQLKVRYSDLDLYHHVNNTSYIRWVENFLADRQIFPNQLMINYLSECLEGDWVDISFYEEDSAKFVEGKVGEKVVFLAKVD